MLPFPDGLGNTYFALRHAHSVANLQHRIISHPRHGRSGFGLSHQGLMQCDRMAESWRSTLGGQSVVVLSSDFLRSVQTAQRLSGAIRLPRMGITVALRERNFGQLEYQADHNYYSVWERDRKNAVHRWMGVESVTTVLQRTVGLIWQCEKRYSNCFIVLVSHGDALQILETSFRSLRPEMHRSLPHLANAQLRQLNTIGRVFQ